MGQSCDEGKRLDTKHAIRIEVSPENKWQKPLGGELSSRVATSTDNLVRVGWPGIDIPNFLKPTLRVRGIRDRIMNRP